MSVMSQELQAVDKQILALKLRKAGATYEEIAKACGYKNASGAYSAVKSALKKAIREPAEQLRELELARLDEAQAAIWAQVKKGDLAAIDRFLKISKQRAELLGLNAPVQLGVNGTINHEVSFSLEKLDEIRAERWRSIREELAELPALDATFTAIEIDPAQGSGEKVTGNESAAEQSYNAGEKPSEPTENEVI